MYLARSAAACAAGVCGGWPNRNGPIVRIAVSTAIGNLIRIINLVFLLFSIYQLAVFVEHADRTIYSNAAAAKSVIVPASVSILCAGRVQDPCCSLLS